MCLRILLTTFPVANAAFPGIKEALVSIPSPGMTTTIVGLLASVMTCTILPIANVPTPVAAAVGVPMKTRSSTAN